jgi:hypothetical protein
MGIGSGRAGIVLSPDLQYELAQLRGRIVSCPEDRQGRCSGSLVTQAAHLQGFTRESVSGRPDKPFSIINSGQENLPSSSLIGYSAIYHVFLGMHSLP